MGAKTSIEWTDASWTPIRARNKLTGKVGWLDEKMLLQPLSWREPRMVFVCSMTDLFADFVPDEWIDRVFAVMAMAPQHTFQVLTKRAERMREWFSLPVKNWYDGRAILVDRASRIISPAHEAGHYWPLPNCWLGVSAEDQKRADERIPHLLATPSAVRFVSAEPLLGPIDLTNLDHLGTLRRDGIHGISAIWKNNAIGRACLDWIIVGGESGPNARPMHPAWARSLRDQCAAAGVPFFFKQWGEWITAKGLPGHLPVGHVFDDGYQMIRLGKSRAGRLLDGREHNDMPSSLTDGRAA
jgi:protein gp37